jgi:hypothetical protein
MDHRNYAIRIKYSETLAFSEYFYLIFVRAGRLERDTLARVGWESGDRTIKCSEAARLKCSLF